MKVEIWSENFLVSAGLGNRDLRLLREYAECVFYSE